MSDRNVDDVIAAATAAFQAPPHFVARAPGRVNLIGEHTDYNGLPVMPMAIDRSIVIAGRRRDDAVVTLANAGGFAPRRFVIGNDIPPFDAGDWGNYPKAAAQGLYRHLDGGLRRGADLYVDGDVPDGAGLSSSAALVVASALALLAANEIELPLATLAELLPRAEQYVGTLSGGMDQTVSLLAQAGHALRIDFRPLRYRPVPLPADHVFAVAHSLVHADKAGGARQAYNLRVAECRIATHALCRFYDLPAAAEIATIGDAVRELEGISPEAIVTHVAAAIPSGTLSLQDIGRVLEVRPEHLRSELDLPADVGDRFVIVERLRHVLTEAARVDAAEDALRCGNIDTFAAAMRASHRSCRDDYEISCPALEELVACAERSGAAAARLTGAGFGGCIVALLRKVDVASFVNGLDAEFYGPRGIAPTALPRLRFALEAAAGASVTSL